MAVYIHLNRRDSVFTNLDVVSGTIVLSLAREETLSAITVKLECESRTRLAAPRDHRGRYETELEVHKLLYKVETVFPTPQLIGASSGKGSAYTLPPGQHEYPFQVKIPFNTACAPINSMIDRVDMARDYNNHIKRPLPPSLTGFPGEAEIRYFVKVTAQRAAFYKENFRNEVNFKFFPLESIRPPPNRRESYARRQHQFAPPLPSQQKPSFFRQKAAPTPNAPPTIRVEGRLPDPAIITCCEPIPLRVLVTKLNETPEIIFLKTFQIVLIGSTEIRAHELKRAEKSSWVIVSFAGMETPLGNSNTPINKAMEVAATLWKDVNLPNTIPPTFETCNISRKYEIEISVGLVHGQVGNMKPELTVQTLLMPIQVYSGIKPPAQLVEEMSKRQGVARPQPQPQQNLLPPQTPSTSQPPSPLNAANTGSSASSHPIPAQDIPDAPPPSYEDAIAEDLAPVDGPRRDYQQPATTPIASPGNEKRGSDFRLQERLFDS